MPHRHFAQTQAYVSQPFRVLVMGPRLCQTNCWHNSNLERAQSRPTRGAWIETGSPRSCAWMSRRRAPHGARELKHLFEDGRAAADIVAPRAR